MITRTQLIDALLSLGLSAGDCVLVHSDLRGFGLPENQTSREEILAFYEEAIRSVIGKGGTLAVPAYFYEYARYGQPFDVNNSPVSASLGSFSQWITSLSGAIRSCNPLQSIAATGKRAGEISGGNSLSGYGVESPWHRLRKLGGKILFLGAPIQSMTFVHYIEQQIGVPHLYFKIFPYPVIKDGKELPGHPVSAVRYLDYAIHYNLAAYQQKLSDEGFLRSHLLHSIPLYAINAEDAFRIGIRELSCNPYFFLRHPPHFAPGNVPIDKLIQGA